MMKKILLIATGGTIASKATKNGLVPQMTAGEILEMVPELAQLCEIEIIQLFNLDSTNIGPNHWLAMAGCVKAHYNKYDGFVILHGTDTMSYTAAALSYLIQRNRKPVVITGSQKSIYYRDTDARNNLMGAFLFVAEEKASGVHIVFDGKAMIGARTRKMRTKSYHAFSCIDYPDTAVIRDNKVIFFMEPEIESTPVFYEKMDSRVFVLKLIPGLDADILGYVQSHYHALVIEGFGVGGLPKTKEKGFLEKIGELTKAGIPVVITTQVPYEGSDIETYQVGNGIKEEPGILEGYSMTPESIVTKLMWILAETRDLKKIETLFYEPVRKDLL